MIPLEIKTFCYVYVMKSLSSNYWYTGVTVDLRKRFSQHQEGLSGWTKKHVPYELIYYEACKDLEDAKTREMYLKSGPGKRYLKNRLKRFLSLTG
jgi:putative endonuclease